MAIEVKEKMFKLMVLIKMVFRKSKIYFIHNKSKSLIVTLNFYKQSKKKFKENELSTLDPNNAYQTLIKIQ